MEWFTFLLVLISHVIPTQSFLQECRTTGSGAISRQLFATTTTLDETNAGIEVKTYNHKTFKLTYLYKEASPGRENDHPIILIHPVGIGLSSWFWKRLIKSHDDNPPIYASDLIGCGINHGADPWDPEKVGLFFPLSWVEGVETLMNEIVLPEWRERQPLQIPDVFSINTQKDRTSGCLVVVQGGLASVGIMLAKRNPLAIAKLMLTSPPTYKDITTAKPSTELQQNYEFLRSPFFGSIAFRILESRALIKFFSNRFLFQEECDKEWLDETEQESVITARTPVQAFNAGLLQHRSFEEDLIESTQPIFIISGEGDKRAVDRQPYRDQLETCSLLSIQGMNVLPWESPNALVEIMKDLGY